MTFKELNIAPAILKALDQENYTAPTPIQEQAIPAVLAGKDLLGCAQTGTGKTAAFAVPIVQLLSSRQTAGGGPRRIRSLILSPTRELALQIAENIEAYSRFTRIRCTAIVGGVSQRAQERALQQGADIVIATPGRLMDLIHQKHVDLKHVEIVVLDEADRMLDMGFVHDVKRIMAMMPGSKQTLFFSATMPPEISKLAGSILKDPVRIEITPVSSTAERITQSVYKVDKANKQKLLAHLLQDPSMDSVLVFTRTKHGADRVVRDLAKAKVTAAAIHGNKSQNARQNALSSFKNGTARVLVATDIAARGIDIDELSYVINFNLPNIPETYVHRIGRTGRAGMSGTAISFCEFDELPYLKDVEKLIGKRIPEVKEHPYPMLQLQTPPLQGQPSGSGSASNKPRQPKPQGQQKPRAQSGSRPQSNTGSQSNSSSQSKPRPYSARPRQKVER
ncbi:DEAD/DEAH box helicase [Paenibacillus tarimensis]|uniref:DEAD/DEAH box helicase n=1 Tax=Paenibacillus tarimensis TaxID=416012 RepID=UPI001F291945|nr:DEAD/DEAH box helicase [Paenibacillus tarimensis]MCF2945390.1 DEAD/DEAH box helicase [Paenibacillus tarimensis]